MNKNLYTGEQVEKIMIRWQDSGKPLSEIIATFTPAQAPVVPSPTQKVKPILRQVAEYEAGEFSKFPSDAFWLRDKVREAIAILYGDGNPPAPQEQKPVVPSVDRKYLTTLIGATILANQPELRESGGRFELDFEKTVPAIVDALLTRGWWEGGGE